MIRDLAWLESRCDAVGDCLLWSHSVQSKGYPQAQIDGKHQLVQRYAYTEIHRKTLFAGWVVTTRCRDRLCCAKAHLISAPRGKILARSYAEGARTTDREMLRHREVAIARGMATKLSMEKAREIRAKRPMMTLEALGKEYYVNPDTISRVCKQKMWREHANGSSVFTWRPA